MELSRKERKRAQRAAYHAHFREPASRSTPGRAKGILPTSLQRYMCRSNRSHKHPDYAAVMRSVGQRRGAASGAA